MIDVLIVEDSQVARDHIKNILELDGEISVAGTASNGEEALSFLKKRRPRVITMDIHMPKMNGLEATRRIMESTPVPIVILTASYNKKDVEKSFRAIEAGALAILEKPFGYGHKRHDETTKELVETVKSMSEVKVIRRWPKSRFQDRTALLSREPLPATTPQDVNAVVIGASTGGPPVIQTILSGLKKNLPVPVLIVQHISNGFLKGMVDWLQQTTPLPVRIAADREVLLPGHVYFAPDDLHMGVTRGGIVTLSRTEPENGCRPSVSHLFRSARRVYGEKLIGVLLTGMGKDGAYELKQMREQGAVTLVQDRESSVIYGMPGEAVSIDAATYVLTPDAIAGEIEGMVSRRYGN